MTSSEQSDDEMRVRDVARVLGVHENTIRNWEKRGILKAARVLPTGIRRFSRADVERMRHEMMTQFAPTTELPEPRRPSKRYTLTDEEMRSA